MYRCMCSVYGCVCVFVVCMDVCLQCVCVCVCVLYGYACGLYRCAGMGMDVCVLPCLCLEARGEYQVSPLSLPILYP